jgi:hypothetical protein
MIQEVTQNTDTTTETNETLAHVQIIEEVIDGAHTNATETTTTTKRVTTDHVEDMISDKGIDIM